MHTKKIYRLPGRNEYEIGFAGRYGLKGEKRAKRKKATPEQIKKQNQINKVNNARRTMLANFKEGDFFATLKFPAGTRIAVEELKREFRNFRERLARAYKKHDAILKYMYRMEVGAQGGIHIHMLVNRIPGVDSDKIIQDKWTAGRVNFQTVYEQGGFGALAEYMAKQPEEEDEVYEQLSLFDIEERKKFLTLQSSRNLVRPEPEVKIYTRRGVEKLVKEGPVPTGGYYIDPDSVVSGVNPFTGMSYIRYTEIEIKKGVRKDVFKGFRIQKDG